MVNSMSKYIHTIGIRNVNDGLMSKKSNDWLNTDYIRSFTFFRLKMPDKYLLETSVYAVEITLSDGSKVVSDDVEYFKSLISDKEEAHWEDSSNGWMCSNCNRDSSHDTKFCPHCGKKMSNSSEKG